MVGQTETEVDLERGEPISPTSTEVPVSTASAAEPPEEKIGTCNLFWRRWTLMSWLIRTGDWPNWEFSTKAIYTGMDVLPGVRATDLHGARLSSCRSMDHI